MAVRDGLLITELFEVFRTDSHVVVMTDERFPTFAGDHDSGEFGPGIVAPPGTDPIGFRVEIEDAIEWNAARCRDRVEKPLDRHTLEASERDLVLALDVTDGILDLDDHELTEIPPIQPPTEDQTENQREEVPGIVPDDIRLRQIITEEVEGDDRHDQEREQEQGTG
jgi:hypothetical protein